MKEKRTARLFGKHGSARKEFLEICVSEALTDLVEELRSKGWLIVGHAQTQIHEGGFLDNYAVMAKAVFVGKKKILSMEPIKEPQIHEISRIS